MGRKDKVKRKSGVKAFFGGTFFGFLLGIGAVVGLGAFAYFKVSPQWINDTFDANIDLGNDEINSKTLNDVVQTAMSISNSSDTYTLNSLKEDFGVELPNELMGINIKDLKDVPLANLPEAVQNKLSNISAEEIKNLFSSESLNNIMSKEVVYYYRVADGKLYKDSNYTKVAQFDYKIKGATVVIKSFQPITINANNTVNITLSLLPLTVAIDDFAGNLGNNVTLRELKNSYGVELPSYIYNGNEDKKINEIEEVINTLRVSDFLGYTINGETVKDGETEVTGIMAIIAKKHINDMGDIQSIIKTEKIATLLDYKILSGGVIKDSNGNTVTGLLAKIANCTIDTVNNVINELQLKDVFSSAVLRSGIFSLIDDAETVEVVNVASIIEAAIKTSTISELKNAGIITLSAEDSAKLTTLVDHDKNSGTEKKAIGELNINELFSYLFGLIPDVG